VAARTRGRLVRLLKDGSPCTLMANASRMLSHPYLRNRHNQASSEAGPMKLVDQQRSRRVCGNKRCGAAEISAGAGDSFGPSRVIVGSRERVTAGFYAKEELRLPLLQTVAENLPSVEIDSGLSGNGRKLSRSRH